MKKFLIKIGLLIILIIVFFAALLYVTPHNKVNFDYAYHNKIARLDTLESPRLIIVGGSNVIYSLNSKMIEDSLGYNVQNMGIQAAIGLRFMVDEVTRHLRKGDKLVIMPELHQFYIWYEGINVSLTDAVLYSGNDSWKLLNFRQMITFLKEIPRYIKFSFIIKPTKEWTPRAYTFNKWGDEEGHRALPSRYSGDPYGEIKNDFIDYSVVDLKEKVDKLQEKGVEVYFFWPNLIKSNFELNQKACKEITDKFREQGLHFSTSPDFFVQDDSVAFDSPYHFTYSGLMESSCRFIQAFRNLDVEKH